MSRWVYCTMTGVNWICEQDYGLTSNAATSARATEETGETNRAVKWCCEDIERETYMCLYKYTYVPVQHMDSIVDRMSLRGLG